MNKKDKNNLQDTRLQGVIPIESAKQPALSARNLPKIQSPELDALIGSLIAEEFEKLFARMTGEQKENFVYEMLDLPRKDTETMAKAASKKIKK